MGLTEEQKEQIRVNRERALEIQKRRKQEQMASSSLERKDGATEAKGDGAKRYKVTADGVDQQTSECRAKEEEVEEENLEEFEVSASPLVSKKEAMQMYCLPEGTLAVCSFVEKENPHRKGWTPMKLYNRAEIRRRARDRFGGLEGLVSERKRRVEKRFLKDMELTKDIFKR